MHKKSSRCIIINLWHELLLCECKLGSLCMDFYYIVYVEKCFADWIVKFNIIYGFVL